MRTLESETVILPGVIADNVVHEVCLYLYANYARDVSETVQETWTQALEDRANRLYAANEKWRAKVKRNNTYGRDYLYTFMRHWLAGEVRDTSQNLYSLLPASFANGEPLR